MAIEQRPCPHAPEAGEVRDFLVLPGLGDDPEALRAVVEVLVRRVERLQGPASLEDSALLQTIEDLEHSLDERTAALLRSESRLRGMLDASPSLMVTVDAEGNLREVNRAAARFFHRRPEELAGISMIEMLLEPHASHLRDLVANGGTSEGPRTVVLKDGRRLNLDAAPLRGQDGEALLVMQEVTAREVLEAELQHSRRLAAVGVLSAGVAHEVNNPLAVMQGRLELLASSPLTDPEAIRRQLSVIIDHGRRISRIVGNLKAFARPQAPAREVVAVGRLVEAALDLSSHVLEKTTVRVRVEPPDLACMADGGQVEQVLSNLVVNAADATRRCGTIWVEAVPEQDFVRLTVEDDGPGIPADMLEEIFTPFVSSKPPGRGSGLGLAIAWGIVNEHGGTMRASNREAGGASFTFTLPLASSGHLGCLDEPEVTPSRALRVLCVDDESFLLQTVQGLAEGAGHRVTVAASGEEALDLLKQGEFDVVLTDIRLPGISGVELREALARRDPLLARRTIIMSGLMLQPPPGLRFLQKPFSRRQLLRALEEAVGVV